jgi:hypothetical protein
VFSGKLLLWRQKLTEQRDELLNLKELEDAIKEAESSHFEKACADVKDPTLLILRSTY